MQDNFTVSCKETEGVSHLVYKLEDCAVINFVIY